MTREEAIKVLEWFLNGVGNSADERQAIDMAIESLSADKKMGEWIDSKEQEILLKKFIERGEDWKVCSVCGCGYKVGEWVKHKDGDFYQRHFANYCPRCGARMEGGTE